MARDVYTRRQEGTSVWVVRSDQIVASDPGDKDMYFDPMEDKVYRHPTFYELPKSRRPHVSAAAHASLDPPSRPQPAGAVPAAHRRHLPDPRASASAEWCGHAPVLEEDIALTNMALDLVGQARARADARRRARGALGGAHDEDQLAFLRDERDYRNVTLVELPRGDFAVTVLRNCDDGDLPASCCGSGSRDSSDAELAAIAGKAVKEARYHQQHAADWVVRLGDGTDESRRRMRGRAGASCGPTCRELFDVRRGRRRGRGRRPRPALGRPAATAGSPRWRRPRRGGARGAGGARLPQHRQARRAQRAHGLHPGRDAAPAARLPGRRVVSARRRSGRRARASAPGRCSTACSTPRCRRCRCAISASCATSIDHDDGDSRSC